MGYSPSFKTLDSMTKIEFDTLVSQQAESLKAYALHFTHDDEDANDLVQDTVLKAITYYNKFREGTNLKGWLYTIMKNTFINNYRRFIKMSSFVTKSDEISSANLAYSATNNQGENKFVMDDIKHALSNLSEEYYVPFTMYFEGYKYHEIADYLDIPIGTVKTRIHVARKMLKKSLKSYEEVYSSNWGFA
ncbi:RNA polymerase sigma-70 factor, ECF subfamily [bacterium A37T11]|nr:RNA polymerase sigma-70 factor, ECF subfamily [bacterium A37T11]